MGDSQLIHMLNTLSKDAKTRFAFRKKCPDENVKDVLIIYIYMSIQTCKRSLKRLNM